MFEPQRRRREGRDDLAPWPARSFRSEAYARAASAQRLCRRNLFAACSGSTALLVCPFEAPSAPLVRACSAFLGGGVSGSPGDSGSMSTGGSCADSVATLAGDARAARDRAPLGEGCAPTEHVAPRRRRRRAGIAERPPPKHCARGVVRHEIDGLATRSIGALSQYDLQGALSTAPWQAHEQPLDHAPRADRAWCARLRRNTSRQRESDSRAARPARRNLLRSVGHAVLNVFPRTSESFVARDSAPSARHRSLFTRAAMSLTVKALRSEAHEHASFLR